MLIQRGLIILYSRQNFNSFFPAAPERDNFCREMREMGGSRKKVFFAVEK